MKRFEDEKFNVEQVKAKGLDYFMTNIKDLIKRGAYGYKENGKVITPSDKEIKDTYYKLTGFDRKEKEAVNV